MVLDLAKAGVKAANMKCCSDFINSGGSLVDQFNIILDLTKAGYKSEELQICFDFLASQAQSVP